MRHPRLIAALVCTILSCVLSELALQVLDPFGVKPYAADLAQLFNAMTQHPTRAYVLPPGEYRLSNWTLTVNPDGTRNVPDTDAAACLLAFVGDSVTFGHGVSDSDAWVNLLAQRFPDVAFVNAGVIGYNAPQVMATIEETPATGFFYTLVSNDADPVIDWQPTSSRYTPLLSAYLSVLARPQTPVVGSERAAFENAVRAMQAMPNVAMVGFEGDELTAIAGVAVVPLWTSANSLADGHADAAGQIEISEAMTPHVGLFTEQVCE